VLEECMTHLRTEPKETNPQITNNALSLKPI
jgi:hypothetical protein